MTRFSAENVNCKGEITLLRCGLLGRSLSHSRSPELHSLLGSYAYTLWEKQENELEPFLRGHEWDALNVTVPYKKTVVSFMDSLAPAARRTGSVNVILRRPDGTLTGDNTDVPGFSAMLTFSGLDVTGGKVLVLGSGGASAAVCAVLEDRHAQPVVISRSGKDHYGNLSVHADARLLINATPVGMYPASDVSPLDLRNFPCLEGVLDLIYNPPRTKLLQQAESLGLTAVNGLYMLVEQARLSAELFTGRPIPVSETPRIVNLMTKEEAL